MSVESMALALKVTGLLPKEKLVLIGIANHDGDGGAWPTMATLAMYLGASERTAQRVVASLVGKGFVSVGINAGGAEWTRKDRRPNLYQLHLHGVTDVSSRGPRGDKIDADGVTELASRGDTALSPKTSLEPSIEPSLEIGDAFTDFWAGYPRKIGKPAALRAWKKVKGGEILAVMLGLSLWVKFWKDSRTEDQFIPHASRWLNERRWEDPVAKPPGGGNDGGPGPGYHWSERRQIWIADGMG